MNDNGSNNGGKRPEKVHNEEAMPKIGKRQFLKKETGMNGHWIH